MGWPENILFETSVKFSCKNFVFHLAIFKNLLTVKFHSVTNSFDSNLQEVLFKILKKIDLIVFGKHCPSYVIQSITINQVFTHGAKIGEQTLLVSYTATIKTKIKTRKPPIGEAYNTLIAFDMERKDPTKRECLGFETKLLVMVKCDTIDGGI